VPSAFAAVAGEGEAAGDAVGDAEVTGDAEAVAVLAFVVAVFVGALVVQPARPASRARERDKAGREIVFILSALLRLILNFQRFFNIGSG
jgi:hypothetical protein